MIKHIYLINKEINVFRIVIMMMEKVCKILLIKNVWHNVKQMNMNFILKIQMKIIDALNAMILMMEFNIAIDV